MDYRVIRESAGEVHSVMPVGKDCRTRLSFARVVLFKGGDIEWVSDQVIWGLRKSGISGRFSVRTKSQRIGSFCGRSVIYDLFTRSCVTHSGVGGSKGDGFAWLSRPSRHSMGASGPQA